MGSYKAIKGQTISIDLLEDYRDNGWSISGGVATHNGCNSGLVELLNSDYTPNVPNVFTYLVSGYQSGSVNLRVETVNGMSVTSNGLFTETITPNLSDRIYFYSDGNLSIEFLSIAPVKEDGFSNARTFFFDERNNRWLGEFSYMPEFMIRFINGFFTFHQGGLWRHNIGITRNNFYGQQYSSIITFYCNINPTEVKNFYCMRQKSDKVWGITDLEIPVRYGKPNGQKSRLKSGNFKHLQGDWFGDFLRDLSDPRFVTELDALMNGAELQGNIMKVTMENTSTQAFRLLSVDILTSPSQYTY